MARHTSVGRSPPRSTVSATRAVGPITVRSPSVDGAGSPPRARPGPERVSRPASAMASAAHVERVVELGGAVGHRGERHLVGPGGQRHAPVQHGPEQAGRRGRWRPRRRRRRSRGPGPSPRARRRGRTAGRPPAPGPRAGGRRRRSSRPSARAADSTSARAAPNAGHPVGQCGVGRGRPRPRARPARPRWPAGSPTACPPGTPARPGPARTGHRPGRRRRRPAGRRR